MANAQVKVSELPVLANVQANDKFMVIRPSLAANGTRVVNGSVLIAHLNTPNTFDSITVNANGTLVFSGNGVLNANAVVISDSLLMNTADINAVSSNIVANVITGTTVVATTMNTTSFAAAGNATAVFVIATGGVEAANLVVTGPITPSPSTLLPGQFAWDDDYFYVGISAGVVKRVALEALP